LPWFVNEKPMFFVVFTRFAGAEEEGAPIPAPPAAAVLLRGGRAVILERG